jgi:hypothetical protein
MIQLEITETFKSDIKTVWNVVTNNKDYEWRRDIKRIEESDDGKTFVEYSAKDRETIFTITKKNAYSEYEFDMEEKLFKGYWKGCFSETENGGTKVVFTESISFKKPIFKILSCLFVINLKKMQELYITHLRSKLGE